MVINEQYYTKSEVAINCINHLNSLFPIEFFDYIIEPCAGNGSFSNEIFNNPLLIKKLIALDIDPKTDNIQKCDYLKYNLEKTEEDKILIIGNPPFKLSNLFIKKSCEFTDIIAFILPSSYKNFNRSNMINHYFHLVSCIDIPKNSFYNNNKIYNFNTSFFIYEKRDYKRILKYPKPLSIYFKIVKEYSKYCISIFRVGCNASKINLNESPNKNTNYFIKLNDNIDKYKFIDAYNKIDFSEFIKNSVCIQSLPKYILIEKCNNINL